MPFQRSNVLEMIRVETLKVLVHQLQSALTELGEQFPISLAYLYGSVVAGSPTPLSDVDVAVIVDEQAAGSNSLRLELKIENQLVARCEISNLDVRIMNQAPLMILGKIVSHGILLYAREERARIDFETGVRDEYFDYLPTAHRLNTAFFQRMKTGGLLGQQEKACMIDKEKIKGMLENLSQYVGYLHPLAQLPRDELLKDPLRLGAAKYYLQVSIESCLDIGNHIISAQRFRSPKDYRDIFAVLNEQGIFPDAFAETLQEMAGLRNRLVHLYATVDHEKIYQILTTQLDDFERFARYIVEFLDKVDKV